MFIDVHVLAFNFLIRTTMGSVVVEVPTSAWLYLIAFLLALFLGFGKRYAELKISNSKMYSEKILEPVLTMVVSCLLGSYFFYTFMSNSQNDYLMLTIPITTFVVFRYFYMIKNRDKIARQTELAFLDIPFMVSFILWVSMVFTVFYIL